ncbi:MAG: retropepsin-like domain-containing protein [Sphingobacteriales bacterium]|nr:retropepsin-like domain-containing protein [Sphingobacteriales bacterium]
MTKNVYNFQRDNADSLILVPARANYERATLALDTGATHTVIDLTVLLMAGYTLNDAIKTVSMETAKGTIEAYVFKLSKLTCLDITLINKEICSYDFLANNVLTALDGVLGLDFFEGCSLNIDFVSNTISILKK